MFGHEPFIGAVDGPVAFDGAVVLGELEAALATVKPTPTLRPREPATAPAAKSNRLGFI